MTITESIVAALAATCLLALGRALGIARCDYRVSLNRSLDAIYLRRGLLTWELLVAAKGYEVGITQGRFLLPLARVKAAQIGAGKSTII